MATSRRTWVRTNFSTRTPLPALSSSLSRRVLDALQSSPRCESGVRQAACYKRFFASLSPGFLGPGLFNGQIGQLMPASLPDLGNLPWHDSGANSGAVCCPAAWFHSSTTPPECQYPTGVYTIPKIGCNAPCPCGSGKKYKHCHCRGTT